MGAEHTAEDRGGEVAPVAQRAAPRPGLLERLGERLLLHVVGDGRQAGDEQRVEQEQDRSHHRDEPDEGVVVERQRDTREQCAERVADVAGGAEVGVGGDPLLRGKMSNR